MDPRYARRARTETRRNELYEGGDLLPRSRIHKPFTGVSPAVERRMDNARFSGLLPRLPRDRFAHRRLNARSIDQSTLNDRQTVAP